MSEDFRWNHLPVPGAGGKTMAALFQDEVTAVGQFFCPDPNCSLATVLNDFVPFDAIDDAVPGAIQNRRIGEWYKRVCLMAHNAAMKEAFYDQITSRWQDCHVFNYADMANEHRRTTGDERLGWRLDRTNNAAGQWGYELTNQGLLGVRGVYKYEVLDGNCYAGSSDPLCDASLFPLYLFDHASTANARPDRWLYDAASLSSNGVDIPGTEICPVFYGAWIGASGQHKPADPNYPWATWPQAPTGPESGFSTFSDYWKTGLGNMRDVLDSAFYSGVEPSEIIPWIPMVGTATFPDDGLAGRNFRPATQWDLIDQFALIRAARLTHVLVFADGEPPLNGCIPVQCPVSVPTAQCPEYHANWKMTIDAQRRAYAAQLDYVDENPLRGTPKNPLDIELVRSIVPNPSTHSPETWNVESTSVLEATIAGPDDPDDDSLGNSSDQVVIKFSFHIDSATPSTIQNAASPEFILEAYASDGPSLVSEPVLGWVQIASRPAGSPSGPMGYSVWSSSVTDSSFLPEVVPPSAFALYTPDRSVRRTFAWPTKKLSDVIDGNGNITMRLIFKRYHSQHFTVRFDRLQFALAQFHGDTSSEIEGPTDAFVSPADVNNNGVVDLVDFDVFVSDLTQTASAADLNEDQVVDLADVAVFFHGFSAQP